MKIAYTGWTWLINHQDNHRFEFEQFLKEVSSLGYPMVENFAFISDYFDSETVVGMLNFYGLTMAAMYLHYGDEDNADWENAQRCARFMQDIGATYMNLQGVMWKDAPNDRPTDRARIISYAHLSNRIGEMCGRMGLRACYHPHANTPVFTEEQIDLFLEHTDPALVSLCLDTAHTALAHMDPVAAVRRYGPRIGYVHLKDLDPDESVAPHWPMARFLPLGWGTVDFKGVAKALVQAGYGGVLCVELDKQPVCNYHSAMASRRYLKEVLGL